MSEKLFFYDVPVLECYIELVDKLIAEQAKHERTKDLCELAQITPKPNKFSTFKLCNPFWLTFFILQGVFKFLFSQSNKVVVVRTEPINYRDVNNFSDDDSDESGTSLQLPSLSSKGTQTDRKDLGRTGIEVALADLINLRKFKDIVPANRRVVRKMASGASLFRRIDDRYGGRVVKSKLKLSGSKVFGRSRSEEMETTSNRILSVHDVLNHLLYVESSDDENSV